MTTQTATGALEAAMAAWDAASVFGPDAAPPGDERFKQKMDAAVTAYLAHLPSESGLTQADWGAIEQACSWAALEVRGSDPEKSRRFSRLVSVASRVRSRLLETEAS